MSVHLRNFLQDRAIARSAGGWYPRYKLVDTRWHQRPQWRAIEVIALSAPQRFVIPRPMPPPRRKP